MSKVMLPSDMYNLVNWFASANSQFIQDKYMVVVPKGWKPTFVTEISTSTLTLGGMQVEDWDDFVSLMTQAKLHKPANGIWELQKNRKQLWLVDYTIDKLIQRGYRLWTRRIVFLPVVSQIREQDRLIEALEHIGLRLVPEKFPIGLVPKREEKLIAFVELLLDAGFVRLEDVDIIRLQR